MAQVRQIGGSFRDPNGFVFTAEGIVYRQVNESYRFHYDKLISSGLYDELVERQLLVSHTDSTEMRPVDSDAYKVLLPQQAPFISYPYEWSFSQLKDAALATLAIQKRALAKGMILKDASAFNIQFVAGKPRLIDTLSFENYQDGGAWIAYKQFCQHFLAPLVLMSAKDVRLSQLLRIYIDGVPLDLAGSLLPKRTWLNSGIAMHLQLHARAQRRFSGGASPANAARQSRLGRKALTNVADSLRSTISELKWDHGQTSWSNYYSGDSYAEAGFEHKRELVGEYLEVAGPGRVWDLGANTGEFSRIASAREALTVSIDSDPGAVELNYLKTKRRKDVHVHPLLIDLTNPSAGIGWANEERDSLIDRCNADCVLALALIHHLAISNNLPLRKTAEFFAALAQWLIIEFVPKSDKKVGLLLASREDIFDEYVQDNFEAIYSETFEIVRKQTIRESDRTLYLMCRNA